MATCSMWLMCDGQGGGLRWVSTLVLHDSGGEGSRPSSVQALKPVSKMPMDGAMPAVLDGIFWSSLELLADLTPPITVVCLQSHESLVLFPAPGFFANRGIKMVKPSLADLLS